MVPLYAALKQQALGVKRFGLLGLGCSARAALDFRLANLIRQRPSGEVLNISDVSEQCLSNPDMFTESRCQKAISDDMQAGRTLLVTGLDTSKMQELVESFGKQLSIEEVGQYKLVTISDKESHST